MAFNMVSGLIAGATPYINLLSTSFNLGSALNLKLAFYVGLGILVYRSVEEKTVVNVTIKRPPGHSVPPSNQLIKIRNKGKTVYVLLID